MKSHFNHRPFSTIAFISLLACSSATRAADQSQLVEDAGAWFQAVAEGSLQSVNPSLDKTRIWLEGQSRFDQGMDHWYQGMVRGAVGYALSDRATIWAGYTYLPTQNVRYGTHYNGPALGQQDVWPGFRYVLPTDYGTWTFRTLWETNFGVGTQVRERPRQMVKFMHPLAIEPRLSLIAWDEFFVRVNNTGWGGKAGFDQNRAFAGIGWNFTKSIRTELGYMNQYIEDKNHVNATMHHLGMASIFVNF